MAGGKLKRIEVAGGSPITLCDARNARGGTWNEDGVIVFGDQAAGLQRIPASGGTPSPVTRVNKEAGETFHYYPQFLPGGKRFLYLVRGEAEKMGIYLGSLDGKPGTPATRIVQTEFKAEYDASSGRLLYVQDAGTLMAQTLELDPPRLTGDPATVAEGDETLSTTATRSFRFLETARCSTGRGAQHKRCGSDGGTGRASCWKRLASRWRQEFVQPIAGRQPGCLRCRAWPWPERHLGAGAGGRPEHAGYLQQRHRAAMVARREAALLQQPRRNPPESGGWVWRGGVVDEGSRSDFVQSVSPDGKVLLYGNSDIMTLPLTGEGKPEAYLQTKYLEFLATFSPDGRWVAYYSDESGGVRSTCKGSRSVAGSGRSRPREVASRLACRREGVVLGWAGWHADGGERGVAGGGGAGIAKEALFRLPTEYQLTSFGLRATDGGFWI